MKVTNIQAVVFLNALPNLRKKKLPVTFLFALNTNAEILMTQIKPYEEARKALYEQYDNDESKVMPELNKLLEESVEHSVKMVKFNVLERIDENPAYDKITGDDFAAISFMLEFDEEKAK